MFLVNTEITVTVKGSGTTNHRLLCQGLPAIWGLEDINCLCILRILSSVCDFTYLTLLLLLKSWQAQSRASRLATYPSGSSPIVPFSCQKTERWLNHSCDPEVASGGTRETSGTVCGRPSALVLHPPQQIRNSPPGDSFLGRTGGKKWQDLT